MVVSLPFSRSLARMRSDPKLKSASSSKEQKFPADGNISMARTSSDPTTLPARKRPMRSLSGTFMNRRKSIQGSVTHSRSFTKQSALDLILKDETPDYDSPPPNHQKKSSAKPFLEKLKHEIPTPNECASKSSSSQYVSGGELLRTDSETPRNDRNPAEELYSADGAQEWLVQNLCVRPANMFRDESRNDVEDLDVTGDSWCGRATNDETFGKDRDAQLGDLKRDIDSTGSVSTLGQMFGDLVSLPSLPDCDIDNFSLGDLSVLSENELRLFPTFSADGSVNAKSIDETDNKHNAESIDLDKLIDDQNASSPVQEVIPTERVEPSEPRGTKGTVASRLQTLVDELRATMEKHGRYDIRCANIAAAIGDLFGEDEEFKQALNAYREAAMVYSAKLGDHHVTTLDSKVRVGKLLEKNGEYKEAINIFYSTLLMRQAIMGEKHVSVSDMLRMISKVLDKKGKQSKAIKELKRALKIYREALGDSHPEVATTVDEIASLYMKTGDHQKACSILEEVVKLRAATNGVKDPDVAKSLMALATAQEAAKDYSKALKSLKKAHTIYVESENEGSKNALSVLERIAKNYNSAKDKEKAIAAYVGVLRHKKSSLGERATGVAETYVQLGALLKDTNQDQRAMKCMSHALSILVGKGKDMHDVGMIALAMHETALLHIKLGQISEARRVFQQEIVIRRRMGKSFCPSNNIAKTLVRLGEVEHQLESYTRALNCFMEALSIFERTEGVGVDFGEALFNTGLALKASGHDERANEAFLESLNIFQTHRMEEDNPLLMKAAAEVNRIQKRCLCSEGNCNSIPCKSQKMGTC